MCERCDVRCLSDAMDNMTSFISFVNVDTSKTPQSPGLLDLILAVGGTAGDTGDDGGNQSTFTLSDFNQPTAVANYIIILIFLFPVVVMSIMCFLRIRSNRISRRDKSYRSRREYLYRVHSLASAAPVAPELSQPLTDGHLSKSGSCSSQLSKKSKELEKVEDASIKSV